MTTLHFAVTYDYRCPFARNAHEHLLNAVGGGALWEVDLIPFSLTQSHVEEGGTPVWEDEHKAVDLMAVEAGLVVKEFLPGRFEEVHLGLFAARHDQGKDLRSQDVIREVLRSFDVDPEPIFEAIAHRWPREAFRKAHEAAVEDHSVFGVPTFISGHDAVFVRIMTRPTSDTGASRSLIESVIQLLAETPELNEFKHTTIPN